MFWRVAGLSTTSPVESVLDKEVYTLEELLDEDEIIQECKALNSRLINFLRGKAQVQQMLRYVIEDPPEGAENKRAFKFPFMACEVFTCEIDVIFKTLGEDEELMNMLFSFLDPSRVHGTLLAGYFSKEDGVGYALSAAHQEILKKLVDLIGITSIMEIINTLFEQLNQNFVEYSVVHMRSKVLVRLVGADEHIYAFHADALQWLADTDLLEMLVDKLSPPHSSEEHANAAETLAAVTRITPSALASKLASPKFVARLFNHVLEDPSSKSTLIHSLSVCISLLDPKRAASIAAARGQHPTEPVPTANPETVEGMLQRLGKSVPQVTCSKSWMFLQMTRFYLPHTGQLRPPLGIHRLKIVEFIAVLLRTNSEGAREELIRLGAIPLILNLFFTYVFNNMLHHHVESIISSCLESNSPALIDHLFIDCEFIMKILAADDNPYALDTRPEPRAPSNKSPPKIGNMGHLTRIANKIVHASNPLIQAHLQANPRWREWQTTVLQNRNLLENVFQWTCDAPTAVQERPVDSDEDDIRDRDYDISTMASSLTREVYRYGMFDNEDVEEGHSSLDRDEEDVYFDDEAAEVVISSLRLGDEQDRLAKSSMFGNKNWFAFHDENRLKQPLPNFLISPPAQRVEGDQATNVISPPNSSGGGSSEDEVVVGEYDELTDTATSQGPGEPSFDQQLSKGSGYNGLSCRESTITSVVDISTDLEKFGLSDNLYTFNHREGQVDLFALKTLGWEGFPKGSLDVTSGHDSSVEQNLLQTHVEETHELATEPSPENVPDLKEVYEPNNPIHEDSELCTGKNGNGADEVIVPLFVGSPLIDKEPEGTVKVTEKPVEGIVGESGSIRL